jgi:prephenate dehydrogenase
MTVKITIIGLGQIGSSLGLALANHKDQVSTLGHDKVPKTAQKAQKLGAVENIAYNLPASVERADVIVLAIPVNEIHEVLEIIAQDVHQNAVVMDTSPIKSVVTGWARELLPSNSHYIGLTPAINPIYLDEVAHGLDSAHADLFQKGVIAITAPPGTAEGALKLAADFATLVGAQPLFADLAEVDGMMASVHLLPGLTAAALAETVIAQPGWSDIRKMAGKSFSAATQPLNYEESLALTETIMNNRANTLRVLDEYMACLASLRKEIQDENKDGLKARLMHAHGGHSQWQLERSKGDWQSVELGRLEMPTMRGILKQQIGGLDKIFGRRKEKQDLD